MKQKRHFETDRTSVREAATIGAMIADVLRAVEALDSSVSADEERARFPDRADGRYPILARQLAARRDNLKVTIAALEARLSSTSVKILNAAPVRAALTLPDCSGALNREAGKRPPRNCFNSEKAGAGEAPHDRSDAAA